jgi:preprotein translocase subunit SecG
MQVILVIHVLIAAALVGVILLQKKEAGIGGLGGGSGGLGGLMSGRQKADGLSKATGVLATAFFVTSLALAIIGSRTADQGPLVPEATGTAAPTSNAPVEGTAPALPTPAPVQPATPSVPAGD